MPPHDDNVVIMWAKYMAVNKGSETVGYGELSDYCKMTGESLNPWEVDLMIDLDNMRRNGG